MMAKTSASASPLTTLRRITRRATDRTVRAIPARLLPKRWRRRLRPWHHAVDSHDLTRIDAKPSAQN